MADIPESAIWYFEEDEDDWSQGKYNGIADEGFPGQTTNWTRFPDLDDY